MKKNLEAVSKTNAANKKASKALTDAEEKLKKETAKAKKALDAAVKKDAKKAKPATKKLEEAHKKLAAKLVTATKKTTEPKKTYAASKKVVAAAQKKYEAAKKLSAKLLKAVPAIKAVAPKGKTTAMSILNNMVLKTKSSLFAHVAVKYDSSEVEFKANLKTLGQEVKFWNALKKSVAKDAKKKVLVKGADVFVKAHTTFEKVINAQVKLVKAKKAKTGKKVFKAATKAYNEALVKAQAMILKGMETYETKANKKIIKGYREVYANVKLNEKSSSKGGNTTMIVLGSLFGVSVLAFAVYWFKFRKTEE